MVCHAPSGLLADHIPLLFKAETGAAGKLTSPQGLAQSREAVQQLLALMAQYKAVHAQLITGATSQWVAAMEGMPEESRAALQQHLTQAINQNLQDQARLYDCREIKNLAMCKPVDACTHSRGAWAMCGLERPAADVGSLQFL